jgi:hypothetical protein
VALVDPERARELLARERERIERSLVKRAHTDTGEPAEDNPASLGADVYPDERLEAQPTAERTTEEEAR